MAEFRLLTVWRIEAPLAEVYAAIEDSLRWPQWWPGAQRVEEVASGGPDGIDSVRRYCWSGHLPYRVVFEVRTTRLDKGLAIEGSASGDLEGVGRWHFAREDSLSVVRYEWHVRCSRWWMKLVAPIARQVFIRNHAKVMEEGGQALARLLGGRLVGQQNIDLTAGNVAPPPGARRWLEGGRIDPAMVLVVGIGAGVIATVAQLVLWWLAGMPLPETLFRDARLTAALLMGSAVLPPPATARWDILLVATLIHFALSIAYALIPAQLAGRLRSGPALLAGALYGLLIYGVNLYGLTLLFPWFTQARDWITLVAHLVFGLALAAGCRLFAARR